MMVEFFAQTIEGGGNFNVFCFLEGEGAQVLVEPIEDWIMYLMHLNRVRLTTQNSELTRRPLC